MSHYYVTHTLSQRAYAPVGFVRIDIIPDHLRERTGNPEDGGGPVLVGAVLYHHTVDICPASLHTLEPG